MVKVSQEVSGCENCEFVLLQTVRATLKAEWRSANFTLHTFYVDCRVIVSMLC